ncbi:MAG: MoaD/ThiS family protein [Proteobacteria bacterium]|jgi:molybdopterin converting factor subunit 1|nr:MoaD/ThiS family protein [Pseudomonadota bacterium]
MAKISVLYFATLREQKGLSSETVEVTHGSTVAALYRQLFPPGPSGPLPIAFAVNQVHVQNTTLLKDGDEVAFLPPLGGG